MTVSETKIPHENTVLIVAKIKGNSKANKKKTGPYRYS